MERNAAGVMLMFMRWLLWIKTLVDPRPFRSSHVRGHISSSGSMRSTLLLRKSISSSKLTFTTTSFTTSSELLGSARLCSAPTRAARSCVPTCANSQTDNQRQLAAHPMRRLALCAKCASCVQAVQEPPFSPLMRMDVTGTGP